MFLYLSCRNAPPGRDFDGRSRASAVDLVLVVDRRGAPIRRR